MTPREEVHLRIRGLYALADAEAAAGDPVRLGALQLQGGCRLIQLRAKGWALEEQVRVARELLTLCERVGATLIINDHAEVAVAAGAHGLHVGQLDPPEPALRRIIGPELILGRSTQDLQQLELATADYVAFGPVFPTSPDRLSHPKAVVGLPALRRARKLTDHPLVAIGGLTTANLPSVRATGVQAWAIIGAIAHSPDPAAATRALR